MAKVKKQISFEDALWGACDKLRGTVEPAEYKHVVLSLIFLKFVNDKFEARRKELIAEGKEKYLATMFEVFLNSILWKIDTRVNYSVVITQPALKQARHKPPVCFSNKKF